SNFAPDPGTAHIFVYPAWPAETATALQTAGWHHWVFVNKPDGGGSEVYQNGVSLGAFQQGLSLNAFPATELRAGGWSPTPGGENFTGLIDELAVYDLAGLDAAALAAKGQEIASHYLVGTAPPIRFTNVVRNPADGQLTLTWTSQPGKTYRLNSSTDLVNFNTVIADNIQSGGTSTTYGPFASPLPAVYFKASEK
ncbi:MAG: LamG-like jellyroll fold domain-containing protein, partial [Verrucomicrobiales bacterium]